MRAATVTCVFLLTGVLAVSLISKLHKRTTFAAFAEALVELELTPRSWARPVAAMSIASEAIALIALWWPAGPLPGLTLTTALFAVFTVALTVAVRRGSRAGCHCFGASSSPVNRWHVLRAGLLCAAAGVALGGAAAGAADPLVGLQAPQALAAAVVAAVGVAALVWLDELVWLFRGTTPSR